ncbi:ribose-5-phosphate isomerase RpiA [Aciditerrimonas ferrireducens]|uniref:ribose-5-phosphate isomerase RpiA n=1 Tax=Aciditerrimonas ferrireducens TaxID=667306 RepID=UPI0020062F1D|nr:ribose-5-phosphate isomerase RpiA [Aciditerrimonas ferrireducens]MCK4176054.1 ribose-5-phosphate isomerase RpiA [Aciditerrimonas ferrireducens]
MPSAASVANPGSSDPEGPAKRAAAETAAALVPKGCLLGLGTGSTVGFFLPALARRQLDCTCVATSPATAEAATALGLRVVSFDEIDHLDLAVDGADQVAPDGWLVKGGGGAHTREKIVAAAAERFVVMVSPDKLVAALHPPLPLELSAFGFAAVRRAVGRLGRVERRAGALSPQGGVICDLHVELSDPAGLAAALEAIPGVVEHGLFPPALTSTLVVGQPDGTAQVVPFVEGRPTGEVWGALG